MKQHCLGLAMTAKRTRRRKFLDEMEKVSAVGRSALVSSYLSEGKRGRPQLSPETMLRIHLMQQWFALSDPAIEEALHDMPAAFPSAQRSATPGCELCRASLGL